jgi:hypothetical protein
VKIECNPVQGPDSIEIDDRLDVDGDAMLTVTEEFYDEPGPYHSIEVFLNADARRALVKALQALDAE